MAIFEENRAAKLFSIFYLLTFSAGTLIICLLQIQYSPQSKFLIGFDAGTYRTKGILYEAQLEKSNGIIPINPLTKCEIKQGLHESIIPLESKEDEWNVKWPLNAEEEKRNENADDNELVDSDLDDKSNDLHKIISLKSFDEMDTKPIVPNEKSNKLTISKLANELGDCFESMLLNLTEIYLQNPKKLSHGVTMFLGGTSGMRMLQMEDKLSNSLRSQLIFMHIRNEFQHRLSIMSKHWPTINEYFHTRIGVITGKEEAIGAWIAYSYLLRRSYDDSTHVFKTGLYDALNIFDKGSTFNLIESQMVQESAIEIVRRTGVLYLGGTSIRITFPLSNGPDLNKTIEKHKDDIDDLILMDARYQVYGQSLMCFGLDQIWNRLLYLLIKRNMNQQIIDHPCLNNDIQFNRTLDSLTSQLCLRSAVNATPKSFEHSNYQFKGKFDTEKCYAIVNNLIDHEECSKEFMFCANSSLLAPSRNLTFIATYKLYQLTRIFGKKIVNVSHSKFINGMYKWCANELTAVLDRDIMIFKNAIQYCFALHYVESMFINVFQIAKEDFVHINFIDKLDSQQIDWSLGYLIGNLDLKAKPTLSTYFSKLNNIFLLLLSFTPIFIFYSFKKEIRDAFSIIKFKYFR